MKLKKIDRQILYNLSKQGNMSLTELSKIIKTSKQVVSYNINKLIAAGIIRTFFPIIDYKKLGCMNIRSLIRLGHADLKREDELIAIIKSSKNVKRVQKVDDHFDIVIDSIEDDISKLYGIMLMLNEKFGDNLLETYLDLVSTKELFAYRMFNDEKQPGFEEERKVIIYDKQKEIVNLDELDKKIVHALEKNSRINYAALALELKVPSKTVVYRVRKLEKQKIIVGYSVLLDWKKLEKIHYKILIDPCIHNQQEFEKFKQFIRTDEKVIMVNKIVSEHLLEFDIIADNYNELLNFIYSLRDKFAGIIRAYDILHIREEL